MEQTAETKKFCEVCKKEKGENECMQVDGKTYCCNDCVKDSNEGKKKPAICEFC